MVQELRAAMTDPAAPTPSVETILHASLPYRFVDHTHADALLAITNTADGEQRVREIYGDSVVVVPYVMPGFDLARAVAAEFPKQRGPNTVGMVLLKHGFFSFGDDGAPGLRAHDRAGDPGRTVPGGARRLGSRARHTRNHPLRPIGPRWRACEKSRPTRPAPR